MPGPHDNLFRFAFEEPREAAGLLQAVLPSAVARLIDWQTLGRVSGTFIDVRLRERFTDILYTARLGGRETLLYVLVEHQSSVEPLMPFRMLRYMVRIWEQYLRKHEPATLLPAIVPVVLHHSERGWTGPTELEALYDLPAEARAVLGRYIPSFGFVLEDISGATDEELGVIAARTAFGGLVVYCLRHFRDPERLFAGLGPWAEVILAIARAPSGTDAFAAVASYIDQVTERPKEWVESELLAVLARASEEEVVLTVAEQYRESGREEERARMRALLVRQMTARFGPVGEDVKARVDAADVETLERWAERVVTASTLAEVLGEG